MKIVFIKYTEDNETMLFLHVQDENGKDIMVLPFYHKNSDIEKEKRLKESIDHLPILIEQVYNTGKASQDLIFESKEVLL